MRLILSAVFFYMLVDFLARLSASTGIAVDLSSFGVGLVVAVLTAFMAFRVEGWMSSATRPSRPQNVKIDTKENPLQITRAALVALIKIVVVMFCVIGYFIVSHMISLP